MWILISCMRPCGLAIAKFAIFILKDASAKFSSRSPRDSSSVFMLILEPPTMSLSLTMFLPTETDMLGMYLSMTAIATGVILLDVVVGGLVEGEVNISRWQTDALSIGNRLRRLWSDTTSLEIF